MIRFYMTYYCGWWCRGSTHLQMQWQGWTVFTKTLWESWPVYGMRTYTDRLIKSNKQSQKQFLHPDHWTQKSRECDEHIWFVVRHRIGHVTASLTRLIVLLWRTIAASHSKSNYRTITPLHLWTSMLRQHAPTYQRICITYFSKAVWIHQKPFRPLHNDTFRYQYKPRQLWTLHYLSFNLSFIQYQDYIMDTTHYWPFAREYSIWNAAVTALQFWTADLKPHILSDAIEQVYTAFFCSHSAQQLQNQPEEVIFSCFMTTLNNSFKWELTQ